MSSRCEHLIGEKRITVLRVSTADVFSAQEVHFQDQRALNDAAKVERRFLLNVYSRKEAKSCSLKKTFHLILDYQIP